ncbi:hypothetical protein [Calycomorphotria hydatis]|uniref:DUF2157 domain-containing protein n=1 Tax=Calycomorphotria hydatis TaxID=2528027 RepID=A0A517TEE3_9PLAN|nr:hypothetical protein [Calycomorphotria hydatis]QDT66750.1 hypothetical protein V22_40210 [Calycomorphotria hydatis]
MGAHNPRQPLPDESFFLPDDPVEKETVSAEPDDSKNLLMILLDPQSIRYLMMAGGGVLVFGLVVWLWSVGVFDNPLVTATVLGTANILVLGTGILLYRRTSYELTGRSIALLAAAVMPLNLWFYDSQGLIVLDEGGHLWIPATCICALYALAGYLLRSPSFAYVIVGGVSLTGLLILGDEKVARFYEIIAPSSLLVIVGLIAIHAERLFNDVSGPFGRKKMGRAFFQAGQLALSAGLLLLLGGRVVGILARGVFEYFDSLNLPVTSVTTETDLKFFTLGLVISGVYAFAYSYFVVKRSEQSLTLSILCLFWAGMVGVDLLNLQYTSELVLALMTAFGMATIVVSQVLRSVAVTTDKEDRTLKGSESLQKAGSSVVILAGVALALLTVNQISSGAAVLSDLFFLLGMIAASFVTAMLAPVKWKNGHVAVGVLQAACTVVLVHFTLPLSFLQRAELLSILAGSVALICAHSGWYQERKGEENGWVTALLLFGTAFVAVPLMIGMIAVRFQVHVDRDWWDWMHELLPLMVALAFLASGCLCRIRLTTLTGGVIMLVYIGTLLCYVHVPDQLQNVAVYLMVGGGTLFGSALLLAACRDRLLLIPGRIQNREGVFQMLDWR